MLVSSDFFAAETGRETSFLHYLLHCTIGLMLWRIFPLERFDICHFEKVGAERNLPGGLNGYVFSYLGWNFTLTIQSISKKSQT